MAVKELGPTYFVVSSGEVDPILLGNKQTEIGTIPEDWEVKEVHEFAGIMTGPFGTLLKAAEYSDGDGVPLISVGEVREGVFRITDQTPRVSVAVTKRLPQYILKKGDVVFGRKGGVERSALIRREQDGWFLGSDGIRVRPTQDLAEKYLAFQFRSARVRGWLLQHAIGTTMPSLNQQILRQVAIALPPTKAEQEAIAEALSDADALIESLEQLIAKKRQIKQGIMQALLTGKQRLPGLIDEWKEIALGDLGSTYGGLTGKTKSDFGVGAARYVTFMNVMSNVVIDCEAFDRVKILPAESQNRVMRGDLLFNGSSETPEEVALCAVVTEDTPNLFLNSFCFGFRFHEGAAADGLFMAYFLRGLAGRELMKSLAQGSTRYNLSKAALLRAPLCLPGISEQAAIATILTDMDTELAELETRLAKTRQLKQGMMQALLTGRIRLPLDAAA